MATFHGLIKFGVDANCPCSAPEDLVIVRAQKIHQGWAGFAYQFGEDDGARYLVMTPGTGFAGEGARTINRLSGLSDDSPLALDVADSYAADSDSHFAAFHGVDGASPTPNEGEIALGNPYTFGLLKYDTDNLLLAAGSHPAGFASATYNVARLYETGNDDTTGWGGLPFNVGSPVVKHYTDRHRFASGGLVTPETWWGDSTVNGSLIHLAGETDPLGSRYTGGRYFLVSQYIRFARYDREWAIIPLSGYYSTQEVVQVQDGFGGWTDLDTSAKSYWYTGGAQILVAAPHVPDAYEATGYVADGTALAVRVLLWVKPSDPPPSGTPYTQSASAGQGWC